MYNLKCEACGEIFIAKNGRSLICTHCGHFTRNADSQGRMEIKEEAIDHELRENLTRITMGSSEMLQSLRTTIDARAAAARIALRNEDPENRRALLVVEYYNEQIKKALILF